MIGVVVGTGPSLVDVADELRELSAAGKVWLFIMNNSHVDFPNAKCWLACDPAWHKHYGKVDGDFDKWHWDKEICKRGYKYIEGRWVDGVSPVGSKWISYNHGSGPQALNLATSIYCCDTVLLCGHDMHYPADKPRHYFTGVSDIDGEYPTELRKYSAFEKPKREGGAHPDGDGILYNYKHIAEQKGLPPIYNCTPNSAMTWFPMRELSDFV